MSQAPPVGCGRATPRWSVAPGLQFAFPAAIASIAGLPFLRISVFVGPLLSASGPSSGSVFVWSCLPTVNLQLFAASLDRLLPPSMTPPLQSATAAPCSATIEPVTVTEPAATSRAARAAVFVLNRDADLAAD